MTRHLPSSPLTGRFWEPDLTRLLLCAVTLLLLALPGAARAQDSFTSLDTNTGEVTPGIAQPPCGTKPVAIARMQWPSAAILAEIHARILKAQYDCDVKLVPGDLAATAASMGSTQQPAIAPEMWVLRISETWNAGVKAQKLRQAAPTYDAGLFEGWFIPDYVAAANPQVTSAASLKENAQIFSHNGARPRFISCPPDWACSIINRNMLKANGLDGLFDIVEPGNRFEMDTLIAEAVSSKEPVVFYYWQPNAVLSQFSFKPLDMGPYDRDAFACLARRVCDDPKPTAYAPDSVVIAAAEWVFTDTPVIASYLQRATLPIGEMNAMLAELSEPGATEADIAARFVAEKGDIWHAWMGTGPAGE